MSRLLKITLALAAAVPLTSALAVTPSQTAAHQKALRTNEQSLVMLERSQARIEATKGNAARDALAGAYEEQQLRYANSMQRQHDSAVAAVRAALGKPQQGAALEQLYQFEMLAQRHERRTQVLSKKAETMAPRQPLSFHLPSLSPQRLAANALASAHDYVFPSAHAMIALTVYNACKKNESGTVNQAACAAAVAKGLVDSNAARNTFNSCWASHENKRPKWWRSVLRAGCTAALVARLA